MTVSEVRSLLELLDVAHCDGDGIADQRVVFLVQLAYDVLRYAQLAQEAVQAPELQMGDALMSALGYWVRSAADVGGSAVKATQP